MRSTFRRVLLVATFAASLACAPRPAADDAGPDDDAGAPAGEDGGAEPAIDAGGDDGGQPSCGAGQVGDPCHVDGAGSVRSDCGEGLHCFNPFYDEGSGCVGVCRAQGTECVETSDCLDDAGGERRCDHGHCEPVF